MAERDGRVLGVLVGSYHLDIDWEGRIGKIDALYVEKDCRRKGLGRELVKFFLSKARRSNCLAVVSRVNHKNERAYRFHKAIGFTVTGTDEYILEL